MESNHVKVEKTGFRIEKVNLLVPQINFSKIQKMENVRNLFLILFRC